MLVAGDGDADGMLGAPDEVVEKSSGLLTRRRAIFLVTNGDEGATDRQLFWLPAASVTISALPSHTHQLP